MPLVPNFPVTSTKQFVLSSKPGTRQINFTNNNVGTGTVYFQLVDHIPNVGGAASTLTTANGTAIPTTSNPYELILTPGYPSSSYNTSSVSSSDDSDGFDLWLISNTTAQVSVQTIPI